MIAKFLLGSDTERTETLIAKLTRRLAEERAAVLISTFTYQGALLAIEEDEGEGAGSVKGLADSLTSCSDDRKAVERTEGALAAANDRIMGLRKNNEAHMSAKVVAERVAVKNQIGKLAHEREVAASSICTSLDRFAQDRKTFVDKSAAIVRLGRTLGVEFELRGAALDHAVFDGMIDHELGALKLRHGASWHDPKLPRPSLLEYATSGTRVIETLLGASHG